MATLTTEEKANLTADQITELDRASSATIDRLLGLNQTFEDDPDDVENPKTAAEKQQECRDKCVPKLQNKSVKQLRMVINIEGWENGVCKYSVDSDYTPTEKEIIAKGFKFNVGRKAVNEIPFLLDKYESMKKEFTADQSKELIELR